MFRTAMVPATMGTRPRVFFRNTEHLLNFETRCASERVKPGDRRMHRTAPADIEGGSLWCGDRVSGYGLRLAVVQHATPRQHAVRRAWVSVHQLDGNIIGNPPGAV